MTAPGGRFADYGRPRRVEGGLRARTARGAIGRSWWAKRFITVLESFALGTRLTRGRSYARAGQVLALRVAPGAVTATVQGSRPSPYQVSIGLSAYDDRQWRRIERTLSAQALFSARLLAGDLPAELEEVFADAGAPLFPATVDDLRMRCSCPDAAVPCKHIAATFYLLAEAFDADPFELLHWRGRQREQLLSELRALRTGETIRSGAAGGAAARGADAAEATAARRAGAAGGADDRAAAAGAGLALADLAGAAVPHPPQQFWLSPVPLPARPTVPDTRPDLLLRQLGAPDGSIGGPGLLERLRRAYERFATQTRAPS